MRISDRPCLTVAEASKYIGVGRTKLYELIGEGLLQTALIGGRRIVLRHSVDKLIEAAIADGTLDTKPVELGNE